LANSGGTIVERFQYEPHGRASVMTIAFAPRSESLYGWEYRYTGRELDLPTGLYYFRARYYHPNLGRFISRDPIGYVNGMSLYSGYFVPAIVDPSGFDAGLAYEQKIYDYFFSPLVEMAKSASNTIENSVKGFARPLVDSFKAWNDKVGISGELSSDVRWKKKWPIGFSGAEINLQGGLGYSVKTDLCCVVVKGFGFGQLEGKSPRIPQLLSGQIVFRGSLAVSGEYKYCIGEIESWSKDSHLKFSVSGGLQWGWDVGAFGFEFKAVIEGGVGISNKWTIPDFKSEKGWQVGVYARGYAEWKPGYWSSYRRRQFKLTYGAPIDVY
jgi:RHS repeat-associated protein